MKRVSPKDPIISKLLQYDPDEVYYAESIEVENINQKYKIVEKPRTKSLKPLPSRWIKLHLYSLEEKDLITVLKYLRNKVGNL